MIRFLPLGFVLIGIAILLGLGTWQMHRLDWKNAIIAQRDAGLAEPPLEIAAGIDNWEDLDFRTVKLKGMFRHDLEQRYGVRARNNVLGHHVLTPFRQSDGRVFLVDRGWVPADKTDRHARGEQQQTGLISLGGIARFRQNDRPGWFTPDNDPSARHWYHYDLAAMETAIGLDLAPLVIEVDATPNSGGLPIGGQTMIKLANNHLQYAMTWYGLAVALLGVYMVFRRQQAHPPKAT